MRLFLTLLLGTFFISACVSSVAHDDQATAIAKLEGTSVALSTLNAQLATQIQAQGTAVALATYVPYISTQVMGLGLPPTPIGGPSLTPSPLLPPPGLVYRASDGLWLVSENGQPTKILDH